MISERGLYLVVVVDGVAIRFRPASVYASDPAILTWAEVTGADQYARFRVVGCPRAGDEFYVPSASGGWEAYRVTAVSMPVAGEIHVEVGQ